MENLKLTLQSSVLLDNGMAIPRLGLGVWKVPDGKAVYGAVTWALQAGYRHIDTAMIYRNETGVGRALAASKIPREEIFVTTKLWIADQGYDTALAAIDASLARLGLNYVDLYLIHWPFANEEKTAEKRTATWSAMEEILKAGKARAIGVSNYTIKHLEEMKSYANVMPAVNQVEFHPFLYQKDLLEYCRKNHIGLEAYSPLMHGKRMDHETISSAARAHGKTNAQILIRWSLQHDCIVLPKSIHRERIEENARVFDFELTPAEISALDALNENFRTCWDPT